MLLTTVFFLEIQILLIFCIKYMYVAGICGNQAFPEMPRQFQKCLGFPQLSRHLQKMFFKNNVQFLGNGTVLVKNFIKTKLGYPNLT